MDEWSRSCMSLNLAWDVVGWRKWSHKVPKKWALKSFEVESLRVEGGLLG